MINQANRRPGHAAYPSTIRSKPFAPVFTYRKEHTFHRSRYSTRFYARLPEAVRGVIVPRIVGVFDRVFLLVVHGLR
jgi:hypothetical protein